MDRTGEPGEYAGAGITHYWRIERAGGAATVHRFALGSDEHGEPAYVDHRADPLDSLLAAVPPTLD